MLASWRGKFATWWAHPSAEWIQLELIGHGSISRDLGWRSAIESRRRYRQGAPLGFDVEEGPTLAARRIA